LPLYNKLRTLVDDDFELPNGGGTVKRGYTVWNEAMEETWLEKEEGESPNDRNDRGASILFSCTRRLARETTIGLGAVLSQRSGRKR
jgi:exosome complex exonuclease DIS3/RRP44